MKGVILGLAITMFGLTSCKTHTVSSKSNIEFSYTETILPKDTLDLWVSDGDSTKNTVAIFLQGGPKNELSFKTNGKSQWRYLPNFDDYYQIHLHQANTLNPDMFRYDGEFTMEMARKEVDNTSEMLYRSIKYFKERGKTVYVMGHSYGAFIIPHYLSTRPSLADKYVIVSGRIEDPKNAVEAHKKGYNGIYKDGVTFVSEEEKDFSDYDENDMRYYVGKQRLKAAIGEILYSETLKNIDLAGSIYIYTATDERVGGLTEKEKNFLKVKGFQVFGTNHKHGETVYGLVDLVREGKIKL